MFKNDNSLPYCGYNIKLLDPPTNKIMGAKTDVTTLCKREKNI